MELLENRRIWSGTGLALGFSLLVAWMMPPTDPRPMAPNWRAQIKPMAPPAPVDFIGFAPAMTAMSAYPVEQYAYAGKQYAYADDAKGGNDVAVDRGRLSEDDVPPVADAPAEREEIAESGAATPSRHDGYRWVQRRNAIDPGICAAAPNAAVENGCRAYYESRRAEIASSDWPDAETLDDRGDY
jgi:hypothetical protein